MGERAESSGALLVPAYDFGIVVRD